MNGAQRRADPLDSEQMASLRNWGSLPSDMEERMRADVTVDCGWGRVIFAQTFDAPQKIAAALSDERHGQRDIALYAREPHVVLSLAPQELFLDPSHTFRLVFDHYQPTDRSVQGFTVRAARPQDGEAINRIYRSRHMVPARPDFYAGLPENTPVTLLVAEDTSTRTVIGAVTGVDHVEAFDDPDNGTSLWSLAVDVQTPLPGVGETLVRSLVEAYRTLGRSFLDLSVMHDNAQAIALYRKLGFVQVPVFSIKAKNVINEKLFIGPAIEAELNIYARIVVDEARRRGIHVEVLDAAGGFFRLSLGGRSVTCRESLSELTSAVAMSRCDDKAVTCRVITGAGLRMPEQMEVGDDETEVQAFLERFGRVVVKPARGEQGRGISVDLRTMDEVRAAIETAKRTCDVVLLEELFEGQDLRVIVIDNKVVAGAVRRPAEINCDGRSTVRSLIEKQSKRRAKATDGESRIPLDAETERCVRLAGYAMDDVPAEGTVIAVRKTANLHTGGTIHDVTDRLHPVLIDASIRAAKALEIPLVGLDFLVPSLSGPDYVLIEANERPGLANHEPQPTAERFVDLLFPQTRFVPGT